MGSQSIQGAAMVLKITSRRLFCWLSVALVLLVMGMLVLSVLGSVFFFIL
jgi:hypothetical protein